MKKKFIVEGSVRVNLTKIVEAEDEKEALRIADYDFSGLDSVLANGGIDKAIGVNDSETETVEPSGNAPDWFSPRLMKEE